MLIGVVGAPNKGKSTLFSAATMVDAAIANYPFTTIDPNRGVTYVRAECPHVKLGMKCNPHNSKCENGVRLVPINMIDVAGLVPGAHLGKGMGNQFLDNLREADVLIQVVDLSGRTDLEGNPATGADPGEEIVFLEKEIAYWIAGILKRNWSKIRGKSIVEVADALAGLKVSFVDVERITNALKLQKERIEWSDEEVFSFADGIRKATKPIIIAANKSDLPESAANLVKLGARFPDAKIFPCCAAAELALRKAGEKKAIEYVPGDREFRTVGEVDERQTAGLKILASLIKESGSGVQEIINSAVFGVLRMVVVYPVEDEHKFANHLGAVLPDAILLKKGSNALALAEKIHTDLAKNFVCAVNARTRMRVGKEHVLENGDIIKIVSNVR